MVIDLTLPEINGFEVIATVRGEEEYDDMEIIVVAERAGQKEADILKGLNVKELLTKPIDTNTLADILRPALERHIQPYRSNAPKGAY
jgi:DNA-binding response OmpR family regulator